MTPIKNSKKTKKNTVVKEEMPLLTGSKRVNSEKLLPLIRQEKLNNNSVKKNV